MNDRRSKVWLAGPRVMLQDMRRGQRFVAIDGATYERGAGFKDDKEAFHCTRVDTGEKTLFAGRAEGVEVSS